MLFCGVYKTSRGPTRLSDRFSVSGCATAGCTQGRTGSSYDQRALLSRGLRAADWRSEKMPLRYTEALAEQEGMAEAAVNLGR